jgi:dihydroflavonol-4-reductase
VRAAVHTASWVSLGRDVIGVARPINAEATRQLLRLAQATGVERFVYTSTLHALAAGSTEQPADEETPWNLACVDSPYSQTKRGAEKVVLESSSDRMACVALCPGMAVGPRDLKPTSTAILLALSRAPAALLPGGGIPLVDVAVLAHTQRAVLTQGEPGQRYAVVGPYQSYVDMARIVARLCGRPRLIARLPAWTQAPTSAAAGGLAWLIPPLRDALSPALVAGAYLELHVSGRQADRLFGLVHPPAEVSIHHALADALARGTAPWLARRLRRESRFRASAIDFPP